MKKLAIFLFGLGSLMAVGVNAANLSSSEDPVTPSEVPCTPAPCDNDTVCSQLPCNPAPCNPAPCNPGC